MKNSNSLLKNAKKATALSAVMKTIETPLEAKEYDTYAKGLKTFSKNLSDKDIKSFMKLVMQYNKDNGLKTEVAKPTVFMAAAKGRKKGETMHLPSMDITLDETVWNKKQAARLYVQYWADRIIGDYNKKLEKAQKFYNKQYDAEFVAPRLDIHKLSNEKDFRVITLSEFENIINKYSEAVALRGNPNTYRLPPRIDKYVSDILSSDKHNLKYYKNTKLLFLDNLVYAMRKASWFEALSLVEKSLKQGHAAAVYDAYIESGISIIFEYNEKLGDGELISSESKFIDKLKNILGV